MEKDVTGLYLSGHPMDEYRTVLRQASVASIGEILECFENDGDEYVDEQQVRIAGVVQQVKMKTTRNNTMMAYVTLEDDSGAMELLVFSNTINQYGAYLSENSTVVVTGKLSIREEKAPQMICNQVMPMEQFTQTGAERTQIPAVQLRGDRLYLKLPAENSREYRRVRPVLNMFLGKTPVVLYFADTRLRRQTHCQLEPELLQELRDILGEENVVLK